MRKILNGESITLGTCYYPEHWDKSLWREDLERMLSVGIKTVRIAEFAWSKVELTEGNYNFDFFDEFLDLTDEIGMQVIMGTPTATPPAWLSEKYPDVLNARKDGVLFRHGMRRHYNYNSENYRRLSSRIVEKFAEHYGKRKSVIGWQIDNEINCEIAEFYSESDDKAFNRFLQNKYKSLDALNDAWGTVFWNQTYTDWNEVHIPRTTIQGVVNPHQTLDYYRFVSDSACSWAKIQADIIRKYKKEDDFITTNGIFGHVDYQRMRDESLDFITYDSYPNFAYTLDGFDPSEDALRDRKWSRHLTETRSISPIFGIMEQQSGANGWNSGMAAPTPRPGQVTLWTMQSIAHGADFISYFRWRTATFGTEMYWHGILDYSGRDNRRLKEIADINTKVQKLSAVAGCRYAAKVAVLKDCDNVWDAEYDVWHKSVEEQSQKAIVNASQKTHTPIDFVYLSGYLRRDDASGQVDTEQLFETLSQYDLLIYPHMTIVDDRFLPALTKYVENGGKLVIGCRSGYKEITGKCTMEKLPGKLKPLTGCDIPEYTYIAPDTGDVHIKWDDTLFTASVFADQLTVDNECGSEADCGQNCKVLASYEDDYYKGFGALTANKFGNGEVYYYGSAFNEESVEVFFDKLGVKNPYGEYLELPEELELAVRGDGEDQFAFILNYSKNEVKYTIKSNVTDMITGEMVSGLCTIPGYGVSVLKLGKNHIESAYA